MEEISKLVWEAKYRHADEADIHATWKRVAQALASVEIKHQTTWAARFLSALEAYQFLPGGRIMAGAGVDHRKLTLFNCFVMGLIEDTLEGIFDALKEGALTMQQGGGVGYDFSTLRPAGCPVRGSSGIATGPVSFMHMWDSMCATVVSQGARRGAMMATLRCDHPDIETFISAKREAGRLTHFNLSVLVTAEFLQAVEQDAPWPLVFPVQSLAPQSGEEQMTRIWSGSRIPVPCRVFRRVSARELWQKMMRAAYQSAEPGVLFIDRINALNNLAYREQISATNPCGEVPLPPYGACDLGSLNLTAFVREPFSATAHLDFKAMASTARLAVRMLDNVIDLSRYPLPQQQQQEQGSRRVGLGITGLASALVLLGLRYDSIAARHLSAEILRSLRNAAYAASIELAKEKGCFPFYNAAAYLERPFVQALPETLQAGIRRHGMRNSHLIAIAPAGSISLLAGNVSSGLEPVFAARMQRQLRLANGEVGQVEIKDWAYRVWQTQGRRGMPAAMQTAEEVDPFEHLNMQAALQPYVDHSISKTINVAENYPIEQFAQLYTQADALGLKGCTVFRSGSTRVGILHKLDSDNPATE